VIYLSRDEIVNAHDILLQKYGGSPGIRDEGLLKALVQKPQETVSGKETYPSLFDKAAVLCHSLLVDRPFADGNRRTAFAACHLMLLLNNWHLTLSPDETYRLLVGVLETRLDWPHISRQLNVSSKKPS